MRRDRALPLAAAGCCVLALAVVAAALASSSITTGYDPPDAAEGTGLSLFGALWLVLAALLEFVGIDLGSPPAGGAVGSAAAPWTLLASVGPPVAAVAILAVATALAFRRLPASRLARWRPLGRRGSADGAVDRPVGGDAAAWPAGTPRNRVERAWLALTARVDAANPRARTPREWAEAAVDEGFDPDAVETLTRSFTAVRYGGETVTRDARRRAERALAALEEEGP